MIFVIQAYLEDYFSRRGLRDSDQYAVALARLYDRERRNKTELGFLASMKRIRTIFYRQNDRIQREKFDRRMLELLDSRFKKKRTVFVSEVIAERVETAGSRLPRLPRTTIRGFLTEFKDTVEAEAVNSFWESRTKGRLKKRAEKLGQEILGVFARARLVRKGSAIREALSGSGFVDVLVTFSSGLLHVIELKMLKGKHIPGPTQLAAYMNHKQRREGWLVLFDARSKDGRQPVPTMLKRNSGTIRTVVIDINPVPPSKRREA